MEIYIKCETKEKAYSLFRKLQSWNLMWCSGRALNINYTRWNYYKNDTIYYININNHFSYGDAQDACSSDVELTLDKITACNSKSDFINLLNNMRNE